MSPKSQPTIWTGKAVRYEESIVETSSKRAKKWFWKIHCNLSVYDFDHRICIRFSGCRWQAAYDEGFEKYNIEHGNFTLSSKASESDLKKIEKNGKVRICENFYRDEATDADLDGNEEETMRIYQERTDMNLVCLMSGGMPAAKNEIAIDRMYADNNKLKVGDKLKIAGDSYRTGGITWLQLFIFR